MSVFNVLAAVAATLLIGGTASAREKPEQPKVKKICRTEEMPGRITPKRVCRPRAERPAGSQESQRNSPSPSETTGRDN